MNVPQPVDGTRFTLPPLAEKRRKLLGQLRDLYADWGYRNVEVPALEVFDPAHPRVNQSFKLTDDGGKLLALRSDFTPALAGLVRFHHRQAAAGAAALRLQYSGTVWHAIDPDFAHAREFTQVGIELIGVSNARADTELIHLARESVRVFGLAPRVEIGSPAFVRALFRLAEVPPEQETALASAIDRKDENALEALLTSLNPAADLRRALRAVPDLYGGQEVLKEARRLAPWPETIRELDRTEDILEQFEDRSELLLELGMARRLSYYTGTTFRAYTPDFGQPLLGGGRYDGALLPAAAGFSLGLERLLSAALPEGAGQPSRVILSSDDVAARLLRRHGLTVIRALSTDPGHLRAEAATAGAACLVHEGRVEAVTSGGNGLKDELERILGGRA